MRRNSSSTKRMCVGFTMCFGLAACGGGSGSGSSTSPSTPSMTVPGAPTIGAATAGDASASVAFTAPASNGGAAITAYTASCTGGGATRTGTGTASPINVTALTNGTDYSCSVIAMNSVGTGAASATVSVTPILAIASSGSTAGVLCTYSTNVFNTSPSVNATSTSSWTCNTTSRVLSANGLPDHAVGTFPNANNPNAITSRVVSATYTLAPAIVSANGTNAGIVGYAVNGVKFDPATAGTCNDSGSNCTQLGNVGTWRIEALTQTSFNFGTDVNKAHVQPTGEYHYHGMPENLITKLGKGTGMSLVGWAADGFPVYARYGYVRATDATSGTKVLTGSYRTKAAPDANRPATSLYVMGTFIQDWEYVAGLGDLDQCNGRSGVTPEFPQGIYHYVITDSYPFIHRCLKGTAAVGGGPGG